MALKWGLLRFVNDFECIKTINGLYQVSSTLFSIFRNEKLHQQLSKGNYHLFRHARYHQQSMLRFSNGFIIMLSFGFSRAFFSFKESSGLDQFQLDLELGMNFENCHFLGFLHFWNFFKELLWLGKIGSKRISIFFHFWIF